MQPIEIIAQIIGVIALFANVLSYQQKKQRTVILYQLVGSFLFAIHFFPLGGYVGGMLNGIGVVRAWIYANKEKTHAESRWWLLTFSLVSVAVYVCSFTLFGTEPTFPNFVIELLPVIGMVVSTVGFSMKDAKAIRRLALIVSPLWLIYNCINFTLGGIICEVISLISIVSGTLRLDIKRKANENK